MQDSIQEKPSLRCIVRASELREKRRPNLGLRRFNTFLTRAGLSLSVNESDKKSRDCAGREVMVVNGDGISLI